MRYGAVCISLAALVSITAAPMVASAQEQQTDPPALPPATQSQEATEPVSSPAPAASSSSAPPASAPTNRNDEPAGFVEERAPSFVGERASNSVQLVVPPSGEAAPDATPPPAPPRPHHVGIQVGVRTMHVPHGGYDPYSESDALVQSAIGATYTPWRSLPFSAHVIAEWNAGRTSSFARGDATSLVVHRLALGLEGRYAPMSRFYLYARAIPAAIHLRGDIEDYGLGVTLASRTWTWGLDTSAGAALRLGNVGKSPDPAATFWLMIDWGYSFAGEAKMVYRPKIEDDARRFGEVALPSIRPGGFVTRFGGAVTF